MTPNSSNAAAASSSTATTKVGSTIVLKSLSILLGLFFIFIGAMKLTPHLSKELHRDLVSNYIFLFISTCKQSLQLPIIIIYNFPNEINVRFQSKILAPFGKTKKKCKIADECVCSYEFSHTYFLKHHLRVFIA